MYFETEGFLLKNTKIFPNIKGGLFLDYFKYLN